MALVRLDVYKRQVMQLEDWNKDREYDRLGLEEEYTEYLGNKVAVSYTHLDVYKRQSSS